MNIAAWCIKNNRTSLTGLVLIAALGLTAYRTLPRLESPEFIIRSAMVITHLPGAAPLKVEQLVTDKLEEKLQEMPELIKIESQSMTGISLITLEVDTRYKQMAPIWQKLRNKVEDVRPVLPEGVQGPFVNDEFGDVFPLLVAITGDGYSYRELKHHADDVRGELLRQPMVAKVEIFGAQAERIFVEFSNARLAEAGLSPHQLIDMLSAQNALQPGGSARVGSERLIIETTGEFRSLEDIRRTAIHLPGHDGAVYLQDIAEIHRGFVDPPEMLTRYNGAEALLLAVSMAEGGKVTEMAAGIRRRIEELQGQMPWGVDLEVFFGQDKYVARAINDFMVNLLEAFLFVVVIMFVFTGWRTGVITGALVPMAMLMCLALMPFFGISLQQVSIAALIIALGMLVDNGVVTSENILVRLGQGEERLAAVRNAVTELWLPMLTSSLTTICAFLPIALADSDVAEYCFSLFQVVVITLLSSWVLSITFIPMLCYYLLQPTGGRQTFENIFYRHYRVLLVWGLRRRALFCLLVLILFGGAIWGFRYVPSIFFPPNEREMLLVDFWLPYGTDITVTAERLARLEQHLLEQPERVESVASFIGSGGPRWYLSLDIEQDNPNYANLVLTLSSFDQVAGMQRDLEEFLASEFPDARCFIKQLENGPPVGAPIKVHISGKEVDDLYQVRERIAEAMARIPGMANIRDDWGEWTKKLVVDVNQDKAKQSGFSSEDVALSLQTQISGLPVTQYRENKDLIPVVMRSDRAHREDLGKLESLAIYSDAMGHNVPLLQLARAELDWQPSNIRRRNRQRSMTLMAEVQGRYASAALAEIMPVVADMEAAADWPADCRTEFGGEDAESAKAQSAIMAIVPLAAGLMALILIGQFNSIRRPAIILLTIPPMIVGIVPGLILTRAPMGFMAFLGMISLMGIIVNNAIMMIDRIEIERTHGQSPMDALVVAAQRRLRPIIVTATTTVVGLLPLSLQGGEMWRPMANTIMFGLAFSTLLTLLLCPVLYALFFKIHAGAYRWDPRVLDKTADM
ncbi:MAG: efflux RND transporter permease subunit [Lentisphaerae bacterium]|nr:efflux RND transporter permease subunit [Lentisphaerota bacterium]